MLFPVLVEVEGLANSSCVMVLGRLRVSAVLGAGRTDWKRVRREHQSAVAGWTA